MINITHQMICETHPDVMMDDCHIDLIKSLACAAKPRKALEIGIGTGAVTKALVDSFILNGIDLDLTCVDNFGDWHFNQPKGFENMPPGIQFVQSHERDFVEGCLEEFDFIVSDGDHAHAGEWFSDTYRIVSYGGILIYHDATSIHCPSISGIIATLSAWNARYFVFNRNSHPWERCERGLLVIQK
jgi:predicted O-methyltransferase YrrM